MKIPQLQSCCCGCSLETGTKLTGFILLILDVIGLAIYTYILADGSYDTEDSEVSKELVIFEIIMTGLQCLLQIMLIFAVYKRHAKLILYWVYASAILTVVWVVYTVVLLFVLPRVDAPLAVELISYVIQIYLMLVVYSFYREMRNNSLDEQV